MNKRLTITNMKLSRYHILRKDLTRIMSKRTMAVALALMVLFVVGNAQAAPQLLIKEKIFNFGYVPQNSKISHVFWLYSTGDDTLKILKVKPG